MPRKGSCVHADGMITTNASTSNTRGCANGRTPRGSGAVRVVGRTYTAPMTIALGALHSRRAYAALALAVMVIASASATTWLAWRSIEHLIAHSVSDDAFYYFQAARTITDGGGVSVDGEVWANGFHPLWLLILLPVSVAGAGDETAIHIALTISGVAVALSGMVLYATARRLGLSELASLIATGLYLSNPVIIYMSVNGLETGINLTVFVVVLYAFVRCWQEPSPMHEIAVSLAAGLLVLSRTDYGITAAVLLLALALRARADPGSLAALGLPAVGITAPWFAWNIAVFDSPLQTSAGAIPYVTHELFPAPDATRAEIARHALQQLQHGAYDVLPYVYFTPGSDQAHDAVFALGALVAAAVVLVVTSRNREWLLALGLLGVPMIGLVAQLIAHGAVRWYLREWYLVAVFPLLALLIGLLLETLWQNRAGMVASAGVLALVLAAVTVKSNDTYADGWYGLQLDMLDAARWIDSESPPDARVGAFNSGIVGYFSHRTTVNLDGVMSPDAFDAIRERRVASYIEERRITYLADFPYYPFWFYRPFIGADLRATEVARFDDVLTFQGPFIVYEVAPGAAADP